MPSRRGTHGLPLRVLSVAYVGGDATVGGFTVTAGRHYIIEALSCSALWVHRV
jgi:hypothetical protein